MSRLTDKISTAAPARDGLPIRRHVRPDHNTVADPGPVNGIDLGGEHYVLDGQPPVARTNGWGTWPR